MSDQPEKKPETGAVEHINLKVVGSDQTEVFFKIKRTTQLKKLMEAYCERQGKSMASVRFLYDGERIQPTHTPDLLEMEDGDSIDVMVEQWSRHQQYIATYVKYFQRDRSEDSRSDSKRQRYSKKELEILHENHRFLRNDDDNIDELSWEQRLAKKYYDRLFKEYALVELKHYQIGRIAMRWRNEDEVKRGKGQFTCGCLRCDEANGLDSWEVKFGYVEMGVKKSALVKVRLCKPCSDKLNYQKMHKHALQSERSSTSERTSRSSGSSGRSGSRSRSSGGSRGRQEESASKDRRQ
ncbi:hypothetical protein DFQ26_008472, partial [Actinomortierella ambigua]